MTEKLRENPLPRVTFSKPVNPREIPKGMPPEDREKLNMLVGPTLARLRVKRGLSLTQTFLRTGIEPGNISRLERSKISRKNGPRISTVVKLVVTMGYNFEDYVEELIKVYEEAIENQIEQKRSNKIDF